VLLQDHIAKWSRCHTEYHTGPSGNNGKTGIFLVRNMAEFRKAQSSAFNPAVSKRPLDDADREDEWFQQGLWKVIRRVKPARG